VSSYFLREYYDLPAVSEVRRKPGEAPRLLRTGILQIAATTLTVGAALTVLLFSQGKLGPAGFLLLGIAVLLGLAYAVPPLRLAYSGYGELILAVVLANFSPALAFILQTGELHRLIALITFPLTFLYLAAYLAISLQRYPQEERKGRRTMLVRLGWQGGMSLHNLLILAAFLLMGAAAMLGLPWPLTWPGLLGLPVGLFQIWQVLAITNGAKPRWRLLELTAGATLALTIYFINFALWGG
jgi:1,4-dihydroxy-2-naphthoate octaprenyltransferase